MTNIQELLISKSLDWCHIVGGWISASLYTYSAEGMRVNFPISDDHRK